MDNKRILVITTGGTIFQKAINGKMEILVSPQELVDQTEFSGNVEFIEIGKRTGSEMVFETLINIRDSILTNHSNYDGVILVTGTDSMEEVAFSLDLLLDIETPVVITGAMKPSDILGYDGVSNFSDSLKIAASPEARDKGVLLFLNDSIHLARYVRKSDSALIGSFKSHPGAIGEVRCGKVIFYYDLPKSSDTYTQLNLERLFSIKVPIWTMTISPYFPMEMLEHIDGLVIAGMGTGSIANNLIEELSASWTKKLPIALSTRCYKGLSYDDHYYKGSKEKYESKGFIVDRYAELNTLQARIKLCLDLSSEL